MKRSAYTFGLVGSAVGFALSLVVLIATLCGTDPSTPAPWIWRLHVGALAMWGMLFLLPGLYALRAQRTENDAQDEAASDAPPSPPPPTRGQAGARLFVLTLLIVAVANFAAVVQARTGVTAVSGDELASQYAVSRLYTLRAYAGFWLLLYGVPLVGFLTLRRELE